MKKQSSEPPTAPPDTPAQSEGAATIARVPWHPLLGVVFVIAWFFVAQALASLLVIIYPALHHWTSAHSDDWLNNSVTGQFAFTLLAYGLSLAGIYVFLKLFKTNWRIIGLRRPRARDPVYGIVAWVFYFVVYLVVVAIASHYIPGLNINQKQQIGFNSVHGSYQLVLTFVSLVVLPPIAEETMVRGFLYSSLKKGLPTALAVIITSLIFASAHLPEGGAAGPLYIGAIDTFILSLAAIYLREKTGSLWAGITLHAFKNGVAFVTLFLLASR